VALGAQEGGVAGWAGGLRCDGALLSLGHLSLCSTTLIQTWIVIVVVAGLGLWAARTARVERPSGLQNVFEAVLGFIGGFVGGGSVEEAWRQRRLLLEFLVTLFLFILVSNMLDVIPPYQAPTNTLNTTGALAILVFLFVHASGMARHRARYGRKFLHVKGVMGYVFVVFAVIEELSKPLTLSFRLFGNIFAGELFIAILLRLIPLRWYYFAGGFIPHVGWLLFSVFVGVVQAFIFMILTLSYVSQATSAEEHGEAHVRAVGSGRVAEARH